MAARASPKLQEALHLSILKLSRLISVLSSSILSVGGVGAVNRNAQSTVVYAFATRDRASRIVKQSRA
jgi:hypothetical protein